MREIYILLKLTGSATITIENGGYLCIEQEADIVLQDELSVIKLKAGSILGANPLIFKDSSCSSEISFSGNGKVNYNPDLLIRDDNQDDGTEPNPRTIQWNSPDISLTDFHFNPISNGDLANYSSCYIAVRVKNIGNETTTGEEKLHVYWTKSTVRSRWRSSWTKSLSFFWRWLPGFSKGEEITDSKGITIPPLEPGEDITLYIVWNLPDNTPYNEAIADIFHSTKIKLNWGFGILARVEDGNETPGVSSLLLSSATFARNSNNVALDNGSLLLYKEDFHSVFVLDSLIKTPFTLKIDQLVQEDKYVLNDFAELYVSLSPPLMERLIKDNEEENRFKIIDESRGLVLSKQAQLSFQPIEDEGIPCIFGAEVHFISDEIPEVNDFDFDLSLDIEGKTEEQMRFTAVRDLERYFKAIAESEKEKIVKNETVTLSAQSIGETASYIWYNAGGDTIGTGTQLSVTPVATQSYKLEVQATADGYKSYDSVRVAVTEGVITAIAPNPANTQATISYALSEGTTNAALQVISATGITLATYPIATDTNSQQLSLGNFAQGHYTVKLLSGGKLMDSKALVVQ